jgi:hypothetical protein
MSIHIPFEGTYTESRLESVTRQMEASGGGGSTRQATGCFAVGAALCLLAGIAPALQGTWTNAFHWWEMAVIPAGVAVWNFMQARRARRASPLLEQRVQGTFTETGFELQTPSTVTRVDWSGIAAFQATSDCLLLLPDPQTCFAFPLEFFATPADFAAATALAREKISPPPAPSLVSWKRICRLMILVLIIVALIVAYAMLEGPK